MNAWSVGGNQGRGEPARVTRVARRYHGPEPLPAPDARALRAALWLCLGFTLAMAIAPPLVALYVGVCR